ncbi:MAG TPA: UDP-2,3-diacylglucosamine diphosphatase, partial [Xanthobacteraceae bacterium]
IGAFESTLAIEADRHAADGVICGHIHHAAIRDIGAVRYINCGDWVESCCAAVEHPDGQFEIISWVRDARRAASEAGLAGARVA